MLAGLNRTNVSASAILMRLRRLLQPGFCFALKEGTKYSIFTSSGTQLPPMPQGTNLQTIAQVAEDHGVATLSGRQITWFRLSRFDKFESTSNPRSATELLRSAIQTECGDSAVQIKMFQSINGVAGGSLRKSERKPPNKHLRYYDISLHPNPNMAMS